VTNRVDTAVDRRLVLSVPLSKRMELEVDEFVYQSTWARGDAILYFRVLRVVWDKAVDELRNRRAT